MKPGPRRNMRLPPPTALASRWGGASGRRNAHHVNYAVHPTILGDANRLASTDFACGQQVSREPVGYAPPALWPGQPSYPVAVISPVGGRVMETAFLSDRHRFLVKMPHREPPRGAEESGRP